MSYFILIAVEISAWMRKQSKAVYALVFIFGVLIYGLNYQNADYTNYYNGFMQNGLWVGTQEPLFNLAFKIGHALKFTYPVMMCVWAATGLCLISNVILTYSPYPALVLSLFILYPFTIDIIQIRSFMANAVIIYGCKFIIEYSVSHRKRNILYFGLCIIIASMFHFSGIFYGILIFLFLDEKRHPVIRKFGGLLAVVLFIAAIPVVSKIMPSIIGDGKTNAWLLREQLTTWKYVLRTVVTKCGLLVFPILAIYIRKNDSFKLNTRYYYENRVICTSIKKHSKKETFLEFRSINNTLIYICIYLVAFILIQFFVNSQYERLTRPAVLLSSIVLTRQCVLLEGRERSILVILLIVINILYFGTTMYFTEANGVPWITHVFREVYEHNLLFK
ncbi:MAG: EpsG family protein [Firmicutes bacterium]|nr:EpsG family protein [Bacillota bacterium]